MAESLDEFGENTLFRYDENNETSNIILIIMNTIVTFFAKGIVQ